MSLKDRRLYIDLIETYKIIYGISCNDPSKFFNLTGSRRIRMTRQSEYSRNIIPKRSNLDTRRFFFTQRVVEPWNALPSEIKDSPSISIFKTRLKHYMMSSNSGHAGIISVEWMDWMTTNQDVPDAPVLDGVLEELLRKYSQVSIRMKFVYNAFPLITRFILSRYTGPCKWST